ncbi:MAG TPA: hypothetical protein VFY00_00225 [Arenimonas sp.]|nr:hypothetical protein [Arenimonas sp.]
MIRILAVLAGALLVGGLLATGAAVWPVRPGLVGLALMVIVALAVRRRWGLLAHAAPGSPERRLWVSLAANAVVAAHLLTALNRIGPTLVMHTPEVHALGQDSWTLVAGAVLAYWIVRDPQPRVDERDDAIAALGVRAAHYGLLLMLGVQILVLGFVREGWVSELSRPTIAHALILAIIGSALIDAIARLGAYARDAMAEAHE